MWLSRRPNHPCEILTRLVKWLGAMAAPKSGVSHWLWMSLLQQCYALTCYTVVLVIVCWPVCKPSSYVASNLGQLSLPFFGVGESTTSLHWLGLRQGKFTCARYHVTLCYPVNLWSMIKSVIMIQFFCATLYYIHLSCIWQTFAGCRLGCNFAKWQLHVNVIIMTDNIDSEAGC